MSATQLIAAIGGFSLLLASFFFGLRLVVLALRTRGIPEFCIGTCLFLMGGVGYLLSTVAQSASGLALEIRELLMMGNMLCGIVGHACVAYFTLRVFRPGDAWAWWLLGIVVGGFALLCAIQVASPGVGALLTEDRGAHTWTPFLATINLGWAGLESLRYYTLLRKRIPLGLADPVVANRFLLWAVAILAAALVVVGTIVLRAVGIPTNGPEGAVAMAILVGPIGPISAACLGLTFMPPAAYTRWLAAGAATRKA